MAVLDNNRWLAARIFGAAQRARPDLAQVARYLTDPDLREQVQSLAAELIDDQTRLIIGPLTRLRRRLGSLHAAIPATAHADHTR